MGLRCTQLSFLEYYIKDFNKLAKNRISSFYMGAATFDDPKNDPNDLKEIEPYAFFIRWTP